MFNFNQNKIAKIFYFLEISGHEMLKLIGLLLGAAVQSDQREVFIRRIKTMRPQLQHALIQEIQRVSFSLYFWYFL